VVPLRHFSFLLAVASIANAIPLKQGNSWTWQLLQASGWTTRTATVLTPSLCDSGTVWLVEGKNPENNSADTGAILERTDGSQAWVRPSVWLGWEPQPWDGKRILTVLYPGANGFPLPWGTAQILGSRKSSVDRPIYLSVRDTSDPTGSFTLRAVRTPDSLIQAVLPSGQWSDGVPVRWHGRGANSTEDWQLSGIDGRDTAVLPDTMHIPPRGTVLVWKFDEEGSGFMVPMPGVSTVPGGWTTPTTTPLGTLTWTVESVLYEQPRGAQVTVRSSEWLNGNSSATERILYLTRTSDGSAAVSNGT